MKKYKGFIIFIIILAIYFLIMYFVFGNQENNPNPTNNQNNNQSNSVKENKYIVIGNESNYNYSNGSFTNVKIKEIESVDKFKVYVNNKYYGDYKLKNAGNWNLFDKNNEYVHYNGNMLAFSDDFNIEVRNNYKIREINEKDKVFLINDYHISSFSNLTVNQAIDIDLDNNGVLDEIILVSSLDDTVSVKNYFSIVVIKLNNEKITLIEEREDNAKNVYSLFAIINIENNKNDSIIISKTEGYISEKPKVSSLIYKYKNDQYVID